MNKSIFYHIPKTGGTWVNMALRHSMKHRDDFVYERPKVCRDEVDDCAYWGRTVSELLGLSRAHDTRWRVAKEDKEGLFSFAFVREPLSWYKSWWVARKAAKDSGKPWRTFLLDYVYDDDFEQFVSNALTKFVEGPLTTLCKCYLGENGDALDFVGKQENLREDLPKALTLAGEDFKGDVIQNLQRFNARKYTVQELREKNVSKEDFELTIDMDKKLERKLKEKERWVTDTFYK